MQQQTQKQHPESVIDRWNAEPDDSKQAAFLTYVGCDPDGSSLILCPINRENTPSCQVNGNNIFCRCGGCGGVSKSFYRAIAEKEGISDNDAVLRMAPHLAGSVSNNTSSSVKRTTTASTMQADREALKKSRAYAKLQDDKAIAQKVRELTKPYANHNLDHFATRKADRPNIDSIRFFSGGIKVGNVAIKGDGLAFVYENVEGEAMAAELMPLNADHSRKIKGGKTERYDTGGRNSNAVKIRKPADATTCHLAEGVLTAASVAMAAPEGDAVMAAGTESNLPKVVPMLSHYSSVWIWADRDKKDQGEKSARRAADALIDAGVGDVRIVMPPHVGKDWNDILQEFGLSEIESYYEAGGELITPQPELTEDEQFDLECSQEFGELQTMFNPVVNRKTFDFVEGLLTTGGISVFYSAPNIGKTAMVMDLATGIANAALEPNRDGYWRGDVAVEGGAVIYVSCEGMTGVALRGNALTLSGKLREGAPLFPYRSDEVFNMIEPESVNRLVKYCRYIAKYSGHELKMIVVDTLAAATAGVDENKDMPLILASAQDIQRRLGGDVHFCLTHHTGKNLEAGMRGGSALNGGVDTAILLEKVEVQRYATDTVEERIRATVKKQKDMMFADQFDSVLRVVDLGENEKGRQITSCVIDAVAYVDSAVVVGSAEAKKKEAANKKEQEKPKNQIKLKQAFEKIGGNGRATIKHLAKSLDIGPNTLKGKYWMGNPDSMFETRDNSGRVFEVGYVEPFTNPDNTAVLRTGGIA